MFYLSRTLRYIGIALLLLVILAGPFFRGLFFWREQLVAVAAVGAGMAAWSVGRRLGGLSAGLPGGLAGWALLALVITYVWQFPWAAYGRGNLDWTLRMLTGWFAFVMIRGEAGPSTRRWVGWTLLTGSFAVAIVGLLDYTGYFASNPNIASALALVGLSDRLFTVYQYPNTAAAVFMAMISVGVGLCLDGDRPWWSALTGAMTGAVSLAFFFTLSRGAVVVLPFGVFLLLAGFDWKRVWQGALYIGALLVVPILVSMNGIAALLPKRDWAGGLKWILLATLAGALGAALLTLLFQLKGRLQAAAVGTVVALAAVAFLLLRPAGPVVPKMAHRLFDMNFTTVNVVLRLHYYQDAAKIVADRPLGNGGWGWERTYRRYQPYNYFVRETHNQYAQTAVDAGVPGLLALIATVVLSLWLAFRGRKGDPLRWALAAGGVTIAAHAAIDFDLSYLTVWLIMLGLLAASADPPGPEETTRRWAFSAVPAVAVAVLATWLALGAAQMAHATGLSEDGQEEAAVAKARLSRRYDPWNSQALLMEGTLESLKKAVKLDPRNPAAWRSLAIQLEVAKDYPAAYDAAKVALAQQPALADHYETFARLAGFRLDAALGDGELDLARSLAAELARVARQMAARKAVADPLQHYWSAKKLEYNNLLYLHFAKGLYLMGDVQTAEQFFKLAAREWTFASEADIWLHAMYERAGRTADQKPLENKPWVRFRDLNPTYQAILAWK